MRALFLEREPSYDGECYCIPPCVEERALDAARSIRGEVGDEQLVVYAGKLIREYAVAELAEAVARLRRDGRPVRLVILGNKFDGRDPAYQEQFEAAIARLGPAATWLSAVAPSVALSWVARAHAVWGWRHGQFERSHFEISTKMVEAIGLGTPIVLYPAPANRQLMGDEYAGFAEDADGAARALERLLAQGRTAFAALSDRLKDGFVSTNAYAPLLQRVQRLTRERRQSTVAPRSVSSILVAGHDFRFIENLEGRLLARGHEVTREYWKGHATRYEYGQTRAAARADIIFCEWCLGNAVWWSRNLPAGKRLIIRLHLQELQTAYPASVDFSRVERVLFISPYVMRQAVAKFGIPSEKCQVVPIDVRLYTAPTYSAAEVRSRRNTLGMVGLTPWRKRPDRALELLLTLRERYPELTLSLKGHTPSEYDWMGSRKEELANYQAFFREMARLERFGVVRVSGYDDQLEAFYRSAGWILSLSDFEGCHTAVAEGGVMGCLPLMTNWGGAEEVYSPSLVQRDLSELVAYFDAHYESFEQDSRAIQAQFEQTFGFDRVFERWNELLFPRGGGQVYSPRPAHPTSPSRARAADGRSDS
jgi:glycosyltransferase involved in cell wall biosynthesis